jgi:hypothetical protein
MAKRIREKMSELSALGLEREAVDTLARLEAREAIARGRLALVQAPLHRRPAIVWRLWRSGGYSQFSGWKSAVKDLLQ